MKSFQEVNWSPGQRTYKTNDSRNVFRNRKHGTCLCRCSCKDPRTGTRKPKIRNESWDTKASRRQTLANDAEGSFRNEKSKAKDHQAFKGAPFWPDKISAHQDVLRHWLGHRPGTWFCLWKHTARGSCHIVFLSGSDALGRIPRRNIAMWLKMPEPMFDES